MKTQPPSRLRNFWVSVKQSWWGILIGVILSVFSGAFLLVSPHGEAVINFSYDAFYPMRGTIKSSDVVLLYLDEESHTVLDQPYDSPWDRTLHADLLKRLTKENAKAVVFDIVFSGPTDPEADKALADAIRDNGRVILAADFVFIPTGVGEARRVDPPYNIFYEAAKEQIALDVVYPDSDLTVRRYLPGTKETPFPMEAWSAAKMVGAPVTSDPQRQNTPFWMNYYGPGGMQGVSFYKVFDPVSIGGLPTNYFSGKVVFVGAKFATKYSGDRKDEYQTPFSHLPWVENYQKFVSGMEIQANAYLNLINQDWLRRPAPATELFMIVLLGMLTGAGLIACRPVLACILSVLSIFLVVCTAYQLFVHQQYWFPWMIIAAVQIPLALVWSVSFNSVQLYVQKRLLEQSLSLYLSPKRVKQMVNRKELLAPGAEKQMLTILFSDIENFTVLSEGVDSDELAKLMNGYFESAVTNCIFKTDGTVVKYIGDAIFSFWNAPEDQQDHQVRACEAALLLSRQTINYSKQGQTQRFRTRVGLHTGVANVGNFGSASRVDYTAIGENINLASRMEGLNKYLGTNVLITGETREPVRDRFITRFCGHFVLKGFEKAVQVYELVGEPDQAEASAAWRKSFEEALNRFQKGTFDTAEQGFRCVLEMKPEDGPSRFYLHQIEELRAHPPGVDWHGAVELKEK
jgi:adenylate cyclase